MGLEFESPASHQSVQIRTAHNVRNIFALKGTITPEAFKPQGLLFMDLKNQPWSCKNDDIFTNSPLLTLDSSAANAT